MNYNKQLKYVQTEEIEFSTDKKISHTYKTQLEYSLIMKHGTKLVV